MADRLERRRLTLFVLLAFGIAWATAVLIYATDGLQGQPRYRFLRELLAVTRSGPTPNSLHVCTGIANLLTCLVTDEGWEALMLLFDVEHWRAYVAAWFAPMGLVGVTPWLALAGYLLVHLGDEVGEIESANPHRTGRTLRRIGHFGESNSGDASNISVVIS